MWKEWKNLLFVFFCSCRFVKDFGGLYWLKDKANMTPVPTTMLATWVWRENVRIGPTKVDAEVAEAWRAAEDNSWTYREYCRKDTFIYGLNYNIDYNEGGERS